MLKYGDSDVQNSSENKLIKNIENTQNTHVKKKRLQENTNQNKL